jgi:putative salt-induced outer membrane protein
MPASRAPRATAPTRGAQRACRATYASALTPRAARVAILALGLPATAAAQDSPKPREFSADLGYVSTSGNTDVSTFNLGERLILRAGVWVHKQQFGSVYASQDGEQTSNLLFANWRSDWKFHPRLALFGYAGFDRNAFAGISRRFEEALGLSATLLTSSRDTWTLEAGLALNQQRATDGSSIDFASVRSATAFRHHFTKAAYFQQSVEFLPSLEVSEDYRMNSESALVAPLSTHVAMKVGYAVRFDNLPERGRRKHDRILTSGLQFNW